MIRDYAGSDDEPVAFITNRLYRLFYDSLHGMGKRLSHNHVNNIRTTAVVAGTQWKNHQHDEGMH